MDFQYYVNILLRRKWAILLTALLAAVLAYFLANSLPPSYTTEATLEAGVLNYDGSSGGDGYVQEYQINARFENMIAEFRSEKMMRLESFRLLVHDLDESGIPFGEPKYKDDQIEVSQEKKAELVNVLKTKIAKKEVTLDPLYAQTYSVLAKAYKYDFKSLKKKLAIARDGKTDFLKVKATDKNPALAAFFVNNLVADYISIDSEEKFSEQNKTIAQREKEVQLKKTEMDSISRAVGNFMRSKVLANLPQESKLLVSNRTELFNKKSEADKNILYLKSAIKTVKKKLYKLQNAGTEGHAKSTASSSELAAITKEISEMRSEWIAGGRKDKKLGAKIQKKEEEKLVIIQSSARNFVGSNQSDSNQEEELERTLLNLELDLENAKQAATKYSNMVTAVTNKIPMMAANRTNLDRMEAEKERVEKEYTELKEDLRAANAGRTYQKKALKISQNASIPEESESNKAYYAAAFSGVGGGALASMLIFLLAFFDGKLSNTNQFKQLVKLPLLGTLPFVRKGLIPGKLFVENSQQLMTFKESLRSIRYTIDECNEDVFLVTSMREGDGKTFAITYLVEAMVANGKKVLVIDTNFRNNSLSGYSPKGTMHFGVILEKLIAEYNLGNTFSLKQDDDGSGQIAQYDLLSNSGLHGTPMEILAGKDFGAFLEELIELYDVIFLEGAPLSLYSDAKELEQFSDRVIGIFASNTSLAAKDKESIAYLESLGDKYLGSILNGVNPKNLD